MTEAPQNTLQSFGLALTMGVGGLHTEVWVTADRVPVLDRDGRFGGKLRRSRIGNAQSAELPEHIPTLADVYETFGTEAPIWLDVKDQSAFADVLEVARRFGGAAESNLWLQHSDLSVLTEWRSATEARLINVAGLRALPSGLERRIAELQQRDIDGLSLPHGDWNGGRIAMAHRFDRLAVGLGAEYERELAALIDAGIDALSSEHVDRLMAVMAEFYPP